MRAILFPTLVLFFLSGCSKSGLPPIDDPRVLAADGNALLAVAGVHTIDKSLWPESVRKLSPLNVVKTGNTIIITTSASTGGAVKGYALCHGIPVSERFSFAPTSSPDIFTFEFVP